jgi:predicted RNA polymerase sigma factor
MATAKRRGIDALRRRATLERKQALLTRELELAARLDQPDLVAQVDDVQDDVLRLVFMTCHPVLSRDARVSLTLRLLGGLTVPEIARAFLASEGAITQRIVRAKRTLTAAQVPFELPGRDELADRLSAVLEVVYLIFNEGYAATAGDDWVRPALCRDALRLGRVLAGLMPREPEVHGVLALSGALGPYALQAAIAACHARARSVEATDWPRIVALYDGLAALTGSPVVELNRAVAVAMAFGRGAGLELVDALAGDPALRGYHLLPSVRADLLARLGRHAEARGELLRAAELCANGPERELLLARADAL